MQLSVQSFQFFHCLKPKRKNWSTWPNLMASCGHCIHIRFRLSVRPSQFQSSSKKSLYNCNRNKFYNWPSGSLMTLILLIYNQGRQWSLFSHIQFVRPSALPILLLGLWDLPSGSLMTPVFLESSLYSTSPIDHLRSIVCLIETPRSSAHLFFQRALP